MREEMLAKYSGDFKYLFSNLPNDPNWRSELLAELRSERGLDRREARDVLNFFLDNYDWLGEMLGESPQGRAEQTVSLEETKESGAESFNALEYINYNFELLSRERFLAAHGVNCWDMLCACKSKGDVDAMMKEYV